MHKVQEQLLEIVRHNPNEPIKIRETQRLLGLSSAGFITHHLDQLEKKGLIMVDKDKNYHPLHNKDDKRKAISSLKSYVKYLEARNKELEKRFKEFRKLCEKLD